MAFIHSFDKKIKRQKFKKEADLAVVLITWLEDQGWIVYKEVKPKGIDSIADIVAIKEGLVWIIETKLVYGSKVLEQANFWLKYADFVSIGIPKINKRNIVLDFFQKEKGIGKFIVYPANDYSDGQVFLESSPRLIDINKKDIIVRSLVEEQKDSVAGTSGGYITPYKLTMNQVKSILKEKGELSIKEIVENISHHYSTKNSAIQTLSKRIETLETDSIGFKIINNKKIYYLK